MAEIGTATVKVKVELDKESLEAVRDQIHTVVCCASCDTPTIRLHGNLEYLDAAGEITAYCGKHALG